MNDDTNDVRAAVLAVLNNIQWAVSVGYAPSTGICNAVRERLSEAARKAEPCYMTLLTELAEDWPEFSGDPMYPVPAYTPGWGAVTVYAHMRGCGLLWDDDNPYGRARRRLLAHMIQKLQEGAPK